MEKGANRMDVFAADADQMKQVASTFDQAAETIDRVLRDLSTNADLLQRGWIGLGAETFFGMFGDKMVPGLQQFIDLMVNSAEEAQKLALKIEELEGGVLSTIKTRR